MRQLTIFLFIIFSRFIVIGQLNVYPDTFPKTIGTKAVIVIRNCYDSKPKTKNEVYAKYFFDKNGNNTTWYAICGNKNCGKQTYNYQEGKLISYQNYNTDNATGPNSEVWDSTQLTDEVKYQYNNGLLSLTTWVDGEDARVSFEIYYTYDKKGIIQKETIKNFPDPNLLGKFKSNSTQLINDPDIQKFTINTKTYEYSNGITTIKYFKKDTLSGIETIEKDEEGKILKTILKNTKGELLKKVELLYNDKGLLSEKMVVDSGYDGFGNPHDYIAHNRETYEYNDSGHLFLKKDYTGGKVMVEEHYEYKN